MPALISLPFLSKCCIGLNFFPLYLLILLAEEGVQNKKADAMNKKILIIYIVLSLTITKTAFGIGLGINRLFV